MNKFLALVSMYTSHQKEAQKMDNLAVNIKWAVEWKLTLTNSHHVAYFDNDIDAYEFYKLLLHSGNNTRVEAPVGQFDNQIHIMDVSQYSQD